MAKRGSKKQYYFRGRGDKMIQNPNSKDRMSTIVYFLAKNEKSSLNTPYRTNLLAMKRVLLYEISALLGNSTGIYQGNSCSASFGENWLGIFDIA
ncbi:hypothetical protein ACFLZ8_06165 [Planctomycetota bacterium]